MQAAHMRNTRSVDSKKKTRKKERKAVKLTAEPEILDTRSLCKIHFKIAVDDFGGKNKYILLKICLRLHKDLELHSSSRPFKNIYWS